MSYTKRIGDLGETIAKKYLSQKGYAILDTKFHSRTGEIDIVARDGEQLVFVEVKTRGSRVCGDPEESLTTKKKRKNMHAAYTYIVRHGIEDDNFRFRMGGVNFPSRLDSIHNGHSNIHENNIGSPIAHEICGFFAVLCDAYHLELSFDLRVKNDPQAFGKEVLVIDYQNGYWLQSPTPFLEY